MIFYQKTPSEKGVTPNAISNENIHFSDLEALLIQDSSREFTPEK